MTELAAWLREAPFARGLLRPSEPTEQTVGLVLSGGGARSSFQIGALRYLYDGVGITPSVITGTSAGSILAAVLAQHADHTGQRAALADLERIWLSMSSSDDMFTELAWFSRLRAHLPTWRKVLALRAREPGATTAFNPGTAMEALGTLWEAGRSSADLQTILRGPTTERAAFTPGPIVDRLLEPHVFDPTRLARSAVQLRVALVALESGELRYVTGDGTLHDRSDEPLGGDPVDVVAAVRASCAIPGVFPPVPLAGEHYVDGGVRETLPAQVAIDHLGVTRCYAVVSSPDGVGQDRSYGDADMFSIIMRSASGIMSDELQRDEIAYAKRRAATVIAPTYDVHDLVTIDPGLIRIAVDYGWLRAQDVVTGAAARRQQLTDEIVALRKEIWETEEAVFGTDTATEQDVVALKRRLRRLLRGVPLSELPDDADSWWQDWEHHAFEIESTLPL